MDEKRRDELKERKKKQIEFPSIENISCYRSFPFYIVSMTPFDWFFLFYFYFLDCHICANGLTTNATCVCVVYANITKLCCYSQTGQTRPKRTDTSGLNTSDKYALLPAFT